MMGIRWMMLGLLSGAGIASAQEETSEPRARPPVMSVRDVMQQAKPTANEGDASARQRPRPDR
jgi:hypothetical protein